MGALSDSAAPLWVSLAVACFSPAPVARLPPPTLHNPAPASSPSPRQVGPGRALQHADHIRAYAAALQGGAAYVGSTASILFIAGQTDGLRMMFACTLMLAYFGNLGPVESGSVLDRGAAAPAVAPAPAASGAAAQIPGTAAATAASSTTAAPLPAASGVGAIPVK